MASGGDQQTSTSGNQPAPSTSNGSAQMGAMPCDPQAFAQFFRAFETFYRQCRPGALGTTAPEPSQDVIPDTPPNCQGQQVIPAAAGGSTQSENANAGRPNTRAQAAITRRASQNTGKGKAPAKASGKGKAISKGAGSNSFSQVVDIPSVFQEQQPQHSSTEDSAGSGLEEEHREAQTTQPVTSANSATAEVQGGKQKSKKKHTSSKKKRSKQSETDDESGTSSSDSDSEGPMDGYWDLGEGNHGIPLWAHERRANSHRKTFNGVLDWKDGVLVEDVKVATHQSTDFILGNHLSQKKRNKILNGDYVDMFTLLPPTKLMGKGERRRSSGKGRYRTPRAERTFENWLDGYQVFMAVVCAAYPRRSMDLVAYLAHVRRAHALAGEQAALTYDENFRRNASLLPSTRWDLTDPNYWGEDVNPYIEKKNLASAKAGKTEVKRRRLCWEFNRGACSRPTCKYLHECDRCWGNHPASACFKSKQQPFRGGRGYFHNSNRGAPGSSHRGPGNGNRQ
ncbi:finger 703-like [Podarcis lilfordi]|uniref:Finger 703-like n=1 Tax=Podarcis lilfordi TaxID=74358 RepID=A0AA35LNL9_9SAUR|nr:finger 703-like [Podarcis lilfordi]